MPRVARIYQRSLCYHVVNRGINRQAIFQDANDYEYFTQVIKKYKERYGVKVYHWAWMGNHYHLLAEVAHTRLRPFVGGFQQAYAQYHHARHGTSGVFWQGRYMSKPVELGDYLVHCGRYIERNPVRSGMVALAWDYRWSSAAHYVKGIEDGMTDQNPYLGVFDEQDRKRYGEELCAGTEDDLVKHTKDLSVIGSAEYAATLTRSKGRHCLKRGRPAKARK